MEPRLFTHAINFHCKAGTTFACVMSQLGGGGGGGQLPPPAPPLGTALVY